MAKKSKKTKTKTKTIINTKITVGAYGTAKGLINNGIVERVIEPPEGGTFLKFIGCSYLYKGTTDQKTIDVVAFPKRRFKNFFMFLARHRILLIFLLSNRIRMALAEGYLKDVYFKPFRKHLFLGKSKYCVSVRELWRVITLFIGKIKSEKWQNILFKLRNIACMVLEFDLAYRFSFQDILPEINKQALKENPIKEIRRVLDIFCERTDGRLKYREMKKFVILLRIPKIRKLVVDFLLELDLNKIKLDNADWYFCLQRASYRFRGMLLEKRIKLKKQIDRQKGHNIPEFEILKIRK